MPAAIKWKSKIILCKLEATYGVDSAPTGALNAMLMTDVVLQPMEGEDVSRNLERPYLGAQESFPVGLRAVLTGSTELVGSGTPGTAPAWGPLARACALAEVVTPGTSVVYSPISDVHESVVIHFWIGNTRQILKGCRATAVVTINAQGVPVCRWTLTGLFADPAEFARAVPVFTPWKKPVIATTANTPVFTLGGVAFVMRTCEFNLGCDVQPRLLVGREEIMIVDRAEAISCSVEAVPLTTFDPFARAKALTPTAFAVTHGIAAGFITAVTAAVCAVNRLTGYENQQNALEWPLRFTPLPVAGNDQYAITLT